MYISAIRTDWELFGEIWVLNGQAQPKWAKKLTPVRSNVDATLEEGKTAEPIFTWSVWLCPA